MQELLGHYILDKVFEVSIEEHQRRKSDIRDFKKALVDLIDLIHEQAGAKYPLFVFIDELDRCRPTYAISMLEEVKHIFGMDKVCFILSTNMSQLKHSVCAVYGQGFDAEKYLKRFFDQSIELPVIISLQHSSKLFDFFGKFSSKEFVVAMPRMKFSDRGTFIYAVNWIFRVFGLDARSQKQVFHMAESAAASIEDGKIHVIYLFFLCSLLQKSRPLFEDFRKFGNLKEVCEKSFENEDEISYDVGPRSHKTKVKVKLYDAIAWYALISKMNYSEFVKADYVLNGIDFKSSIFDSLHKEYIESHGRDSDWRPQIAGYFKLVRYAGYVG